MLMPMVSAWAWALDASGRVFLLMQWHTQYFFSYLFILFMIGSVCAWCMPTIFIIIGTCDKVVFCLSCIETSVTDKTWFWLESIDEEVPKTVALRYLSSHRLYHLVGRLLQWKARALPTLCVRVIMINNNLLVCLPTTNFVQLTDTGIETHSLSQVSAVWHLSCVGCVGCGKRLSIGFIIIIICLPPHTLFSSPSPQNLSTAAVVPRQNARR